MSADFTKRCQKRVKCGPFHYSDCGRAAFKQIEDKWLCSRHAGGLKRSQLARKARKSESDKQMAIAVELSKALGIAVSYHGGKAVQTEKFVVSEQDLRKLVSLIRSEQ